MQCWLHCKFRRLIITRESPGINSYSIYLLLLDYLLSSIFCVPCLRYIDFILGARSLLHTSIFIIR
jgi:hypothetical protein